MKTISCIIIDDEELARTLLATYVAKLSHLKIKGSYENALDALPIIKNEHVDLVFLDIQMPEIRGTDFAKLLPASTQVIFTTAYSDYAIEGFELKALDYLLKPIRFERFVDAVNRLEVSKTSEETDFITIKSGYDLNKVKLSDILYIESESEYVMFYLKNRKILSYLSLKKLENTLPSHSFMRVHRSFIVNINHVSGLKCRDLIVGEKHIPVSTRYYEQVKNEMF
ncbi:LytR/AlgR family response regulator transcription factor [Leeuwenhoekiella sp. LLG6367-2.1]|uniref:LytR/AlgR family response regulator transcription factor n=1 Tax=Leeuwenhoekiella sp. LLG6367-2.1 TaxID=3160833 RepID=UPI003869C55D